MERFLFTPLDEPQPRTNAFAAGWGIQIALIAALLAVGTLAPTVIPQVSRVITTALVLTPAPVPQTPQPRVKFKAPPVTTARTLVIPVTPPQHRTEQQVEAPQIAVMIAPTVPNMGTGSSAKPTLAKPAIKIQTGGFGDPNGLPAVATTSKNAPNIAALGAFDLPEGSGKGNGHGGKIPGVTTSTGFGNGEATGTPTGHKVTVATSNFDNHVVTDTGKSPVATQVATTPAQITNKPTPQYTEEGRKLHVQGAVRVQVRLLACGCRVEVLNVVSGLGHGLDEQAVRAAQQIQFKPAQREGIAADSTVVLSILFELAS